MDEIILTTNGKLSAETVSAISKALQKRFGGDSVRCETDPSIIGGFTVRYNGTFYDVSIATRLEQLKSHVSESEAEQ